MFHRHSKSHQHVLLLNLCVALIVAYLVFLVGSEKKFDKQEDTSDTNEGNGTATDVRTSDAFKQIAVTNFIGIRDSRLISNVRTLVMIAICTNKAFSASWLVRIIPC